MTYLKRIVVVVLAVPALLSCLMLWPIEYVRKGRIDAENTPMDRLTRWAR